MQLKGSTITFNGINSSRYGLYLCSVGGDDARQVGIIRTPEVVNGTIKSIENESPRFDLQLIKLDKNGDPSPISEDDEHEIVRWLFSPQEFKPLIVDQKSIVYYGMFVDGSLWVNQANQGYFTVSFQLSAPHAYSVLQNSNFRVNGNRDITITSKHTYGMYNEVDMEIQLIGGNSFTVRNHTTNQTMKLTNLPKGCTHIYIYNDRVKHIENMDNKEQNLRGNFNKVFIHLGYGVNNLTISGNGVIRFLSQAKLLIN